MKLIRKNIKEEEYRLYCRLNDQLTNFGLIHSSRCAGLLFFISVFFFLFLMNTLTPFVADDIANNLYQKSDSILNDSLINALDLYKSWTGRLLGSFFVTLFLRLNKVVFNIFNSLFFVLLIMILYYLIKGTFRGFRLSVLIYIISSLFLFTPAFGQDFLWETGSIVYLWGCTIGVLPLLFLRKQLFSEDCIIDNIFICLLLGLVGFFSTLTLENISISVVVLYFAAMFFQQRIYKWEIFMILGLFVGTFTLMMAPGNFTRVLAVEDNNGNSLWGYFINISYVIISLFDIDSLFPLLFMSFVIIVNNSVKPNRNVLLFALGFFICHFSMVGTPFGSYTERVKICPLLFEIVFCGTLIDLFAKQGTRQKAITTITILLFCLSSLYSVAYGSFGFIKYYQLNLQQEQEIVKQINEGEKDIVVNQPYIPHSKYCAGYKLETITNDTAFWVNQAYAKKYKVRSIKSN